MPADKNGFTQDELNRLHGGNYHRDNVTLPGEEVPPSVRALMSPEALAIERKMGLTFEEQALAVKAAGIAQLRNISISEVTEDMLSGKEAPAQERISEETRIKQEAANRAIPAPPDSANVAADTAPAATTKPVPAAPATPVIPPAPTPPATTTFGGKK